MKNLEGMISISQPTSTHRDGYISIVVIDEQSGSEAISVEVELADFAACLTGRGRVPCQIEWKNPERIGKLRETKIERVFVPDGEWNSRHETARKALAEHEIDGWHGLASDATNHKRSTDGDPPKGQKGKWYNVGFERWVDAPGEAE